jgi:hypothetical protein
MIILLTSLLSGDDISIPLYCTWRILVHSHFLVINHHSSMVLDYSYWCLILADSPRSCCSLLRHCSLLLMGVGIIEFFSSLDIVVVVIAVVLLRGGVAWAPAPRQSKEGEV